MNDEPEYDKQVEAEKAPYQHSPEDQTFGKGGEDQVERAFRDARVARRGNKGDGGVDHDDGGEAFSIGDVAAESRQNKIGNRIQGDLIPEGEEYAAYDDARRGKKTAYGVGV